jgi:site-specific recombinase XerD
MKPNNFAYYLTGFLTKYLPGEIGASVNTISTYRDTFTLLLEFMRDKQHVAVEKITLDKLTKENIEKFLNWIKCEKGIMSYMTIDGIKLLFEMPDVSTRGGRRDLALLSLMYDTGARVQETVDLTPSCVRLESPYTIGVCQASCRINTSLHTGYPPICH